MFSTSFSFRDAVTNVKCYIMNGMINTRPYIYQIDNITNVRLLKGVLIQFPLARHMGKKKERSKTTPL